MKYSDIPQRFSIPFADQAGAGYKWQVPEESQIGIADGRASYTTGFPPLNFLPIGAAGVPPFGQDFNGLLNQATAWIRFAGIAGVSSKYDVTWSTKTGGYPKGAMLQNSSTPKKFWISLVDDNTSNPDAAGANWTSFPIETSVMHYGVDSGVANAMKALALDPPIAALVDGLVVGIAVNASVTGSSTLEVYDQTGASLGAKPIIHSNGIGTISGDAPSGMRAWFTYDGTRNAWQITNVPSNAPTAVYLRANGAGGATYTNNTPSVATNWSVVESAIGDSTFVNGVLTIGAKTAGVWSIAANLGIATATASWTSKPEIYANTGIIGHSEYGQYGTALTGNGPVLATARLTAGQTVWTSMLQNTGSNQQSSTLDTLFMQRIGA